MSKKHFNAIAAAIAVARPRDDDPGFAAWRTTMLQVSLTLGGFNPAFDRDRFVAACFA